MLRYPTERKVYLRTLQPRHRAIFILRLGQTIDDQSVTMIQPNRIGNLARRATTHLELHRIALTHTDYELGRILWAEQGLVIAVQGMCDSKLAYRF